MRTMVLMSLFFTIALSGCHELAATAEKSLQGTAAPLKEPELPNTSKLLACCANLSTRVETKDFVKNVCPNLTTQTNKVIDSYVSLKKAINDDKVISAEQKTKDLAALKATSQTNLEPASRCLIVETVGKVSLNGFLSPADCEQDNAVGALPAGKSCDDVKGAIMDAK